MTTKTAHTIPGPSASDALTKSYAHPRLVPRVFEARPNIEFKVLAFRLRKAIESEDIDLLKSAATAMTPEERMRALEQFEAEDLAKSETVEKGFWNPAHRKFDSPVPVERYNQNLDQAQAPAPTPTGPKVLEPAESGWLRSAEAGAVVNFTLDGMVHTGKILAWGKRGARVVIHNGDVANVTWADLKAGPAPVHRAEYERNVQKSHEAALRSGWARSQALGLWALDPAERVAFLKSRGA